MKISLIALKQNYNENLKYFNTYYSYKWCKTELVDIIKLK